MVKILLRIPNAPLSVKGESKWPAFFIRTTPRARSFAPGNAFRSELGQDALTFQPLGRARSFYDRVNGSLASAGLFRIGVVLATDRSCDSPVGPIPRPRSELPGRPRGQRTNPVTPKDG
jgi:hypothetical protein